MEQLHHPPETSQRPMRAMIEIVNGQLRVFPIASSDEDEARILDAVRFFTGAGHAE